MRSSVFLLKAICLTLLTSCGNANDGKAFSPYRSRSTASITSSPTVTAPSVKLLYCKGPSILSPFQDFNTLFSGSVLCPMEGPSLNNQGAGVRLKVNSAMPVNARLCMVPFVRETPVTETCFSINGQADVMLSTDQYTSVVVVAESDLGLYKSYLATPGLSVPRRIVYTLQ